MFKTKKLDELHEITDSHGNTVAIMRCGAGLAQNVTELLNLQLKDLRRQVEAGTARDKLSDVEWQVLGILGGTGELEAEDYGETQDDITE